MSAANTIPGARVSPRIANGCICWYEGDTFSLRLRLELEDQDGADVAIGQTDTIKGKAIGVNVDSSGMPKFRVRKPCATYEAALTWLKTKANISSGT